MTHEAHFFTARVVQPSPSPLFVLFASIGAAAAATVANAAGAATATVAAAGSATSAAAASAAAASAAAATGAIDGGFNDGDGLGGAVVGSRRRGDASGGRDRQEQEMVARAQAWRQKALERFAGKSEGPESPHELFLLVGVCAHACAHAGVHACVPA